MAESQAPDDFTLPLGDIPFGWTFAGLDNRYWAAGSGSRFRLGRAPDPER